MANATALSPTEWLAGLRFMPDDRINIGLAMGRGLTAAAGSPALRAVVGISYTPKAPELRPIRTFQPPRPDGDSDGDGIRDSADKCPTEPEDKDLYEDHDGCPDKDNDGDKIADADDKCPLDAEDFDGFEDTDGCPDKDNDNDGIPDAVDKCPNDPEDKDGFEDIDGCPDLDNDKDGIEDSKDKCPLEPETINGNKDDDGCPDAGDSAIVLSPDRIEILDPITFDRGTRIVISKASFNVLGQVAATMRAHPEIIRLRVTSHVHPSGNYDKDQELSDKRAQVVRDWLVQWGLPAKRVEARGFGGTKPLAPADQKGAAAINDRIELIILERK
jgi:outer membrane protein OmpA-like peptidoglycan-associated protein